MSLWNQLMLEYGGTIEVVAALTNFAAGFLAWRNNIHNWWIGAISVGIYVVVFYQAHLFADMGLNVFFFVTQFWGWYYWLGLKRSGKFDSIFQNREPIKFLSSKQRYIFTIITVIGSLFLAYFLQKYTSASVPWADSLISSFSVFAEILLILKFTENWYLWVPVDFASCLLYGYKGLYITTLLYFWFLIQAVWASYDWYRWAQKIGATTITSLSISNCASFPPGSRVKVYTNGNGSDKEYTVISCDPEKHLLTVQ